MKAAAYMRKVEIRAHIEREGTSLYRLDIIQIESTGGMPVKTVRAEKQRFFSEHDARTYARQRYGIQDKHIRRV